MAKPHLTVDILKYADPVLRGCVPVVINNVTLWGAKGRYPTGTKGTL